MKQNILMSSLLALMLTGCVDSGYREKEQTSSVLVDGESNAELGLSLFNRHCSACHGDDALGKESLKSPSIVGKTPSQIELAIESVAYMNSLQHLLNRQNIVDISAYLVSLIDTKVAATSISNASESCKPTAIDMNSAELITLVGSQGSYRILSKNVQYPVTIFCENNDDLQFGYVISETQREFLVNDLTDQVVRTAIFESGDNVQKNQHYQLSGKQLFDSWKRLSEQLISYSSIQQNFTVEEILNPSLLTESEYEALNNLLWELERSIKIEPCSNPNNVQGYVFNQDSNYDCYIDGEFNEIL